MPAAAVDGPRRRWRTKRRGKGRGGYLFNHKALAKVFRGKLLACLKAQGLSPPVVLPERWVVDCKRLDHGGAAVVYLGRYLYRGVIQERDILRCDDTGVTYRWRNSKTGKMQQRTVSGAEFLRLVLQHALPKGFRRARSYGFLHPNAKRMAALLSLLVFKTPPQRPEPDQRQQMRCVCCGAIMRIVLLRTPARVPDAAAASPPMQTPPADPGDSAGAQA